MRFSGTIALLPILLTACATAPIPSRTAGILDEKVVSECRRQIDGKMYATVQKACAPVKRYTAVDPVATLDIRLLEHDFDILMRRPEIKQYLVDQAEKQDPTDVVKLAPMYLDLGFSQLRFMNAPEAAIPPLERALSYPPAALDQKLRYEGVRSLLTAYTRAGRYDDAIALTESYQPPSGQLGMATLASDIWWQRIRAAQDAGLSPDPSWVARRWAILRKQAVSGEATELRRTGLHCIMPLHEVKKMFRNEGQALVEVFVGPSMSPGAAATIAQSSGYARLDETALAMAQRIQCAPEQTPARFRMPFHLKVSAP